MSGFTGGEWHVMGGETVEKVFNARFVIVSDKIEDAIIASLGGDVPEEEANAHLLSAAPALFSICQTLLSMFAGTVEDDVPLAIGYANYNALKAALAKARGDGA